MSKEPGIQDAERFIETCLELNLLCQTDADSLHAMIGKEGSLVATTALQRGLLTATDIDIVQSLQYPMRAVPGYRILELLGRGAMGVVYRAEQLDLERTVALKTILISNVNDPNIAARFEREAKSLARLQHPNIVQALNYGQHEGRYFFTMEYVSGWTCEQMIAERGFLPAPNAWSIVRQVASGLMHALGQNLIHRDIKPANLILLPPPEGSASQAEIVKIADFGLAMFADQSTEQLKLTTGDKIMGSPAYMSLEQFGGQPVDFRSDIYSLGATAWHLLFGSLPFDGGNIGALFRQKSQPIVVDRSALPVDLPDDQMQLLIGLLDPDPNKRPQSYEQLIDAIDALGLDFPDRMRASNSRHDPNQATPHSKTRAPSFSTPTSPTLTSPRELNSTQGSDPIVTPSSDLTPTVELSRASLTPKKRRRTWSRIGIVAAASLGLSIFAIGYMFFGSVQRGPRTFTRVSGTTPLFDGVTLRGWDVGGSMVGAWNTVQAPDSSTAIACITRRGALTRRVPDTPHPRISLFVWLRQDSGPVDIDFALDIASRSDVRGCLRLTGALSQLGEKDSDFGELDVAVQTDALSTIHDRYHVVDIERQETDWYVFLEQRLVGTLPIGQVGKGDAIRLVVHGDKSVQQDQSQSFFADVQLNELRSKTNLAEAADDSQ